MTGCPSTHAVWAAGLAVYFWIKGELPSRLNLFQVVPLILVPRFYCCPAAVRAAMTTAVLVAPRSAAMPSSSSR